jgi:hypothetical protein
MLALLLPLMLPGPESPALDREDVAILRAVVAQKDRGMLDFYRKGGGVCIARDTAPWSDFDTAQLRTLRERPARPSDSKTVTAFADALRAAPLETVEAQAERAVPPDLLPATDLDATGKCTITLSVSTPRHFGRFAIASTDYRGQCWCGHGGVYLMERRAGGWQAIQSMYEWIA